MPRSSYNLCWGWKTVLLLPLVDVTYKKKKWQTWLAAMDYLDRKSCFRNFLHSKMANFVSPVTLSSATFQTSNPIASDLCFLVCNNQNQNQQTEMLKKGVNLTTETRKWASAALVWSLNPWISCAWSILSKGPPSPSLPHLFSWQVSQDTRKPICYVPLA